MRGDTPLFVPVKSTSCSMAWGRGQDINPVVSSPQHCQAAMGAQLELGSLSCTTVGQNLKQSSLPGEGTHGLVQPSTKNVHRVTSGGHFLFLALWELADPQVQSSLLPALYTLNPQEVHLI